MCNVKDQMSLKSPRLIYYLTLSGKIVATAMDKELNTRKKFPFGSPRTHKTPANQFLELLCALAFATAKRSRPRIEYAQRANVTGSTIM